jgi:hypothetical protein
MVMGDAAPWCHVVTKIPRLAHKQHPAGGPGPFARASVPTDQRADTGCAMAIVHRHPRLMVAEPARLSSCLSPRPVWRHRRREPGRAGGSTPRGVSSRGHVVGPAMCGRSALGGRAVGSTGGVAAPRQELNPDEHASAAGATPSGPGRPDQRHRQEHASVILRGSLGTRTDERVGHSMSGFAWRVLTMPVASWSRLTPARVAASRR